MGDAVVRCTYDPQLRSNPRTKDPVFKIVENRVKSRDPRLTYGPEFYTLDAPSRLPLPNLVYDVDWVGSDPQTHLIAFNLPSDVHEAELRGAVEYLGDLSICNLALDPTGACLGFAKIRFQGNVLDARSRGQTLLQEQNILIRGRRVCFAADDDTGTVFTKMAKDAAQVNSNENRIRQNPASRSKTPVRSDSLPVKVENTIPTLNNSEIQNGFLPNGSSEFWFAENELRRARTTRKAKTNWLEANIGNTPYIKVDTAPAMLIANVTANDISHHFRDFGVHSVLEFYPSLYVLFPNPESAKACYCTFNSELLGSIQLKLTLSLPNPQTLPPPNPDIINGSDLDGAKLLLDPYSPLVKQSTPAMYSTKRVSDRPKNHSSGVKKRKSPIDPPVSEAETGWVPLRKSVLAKVLAERSPTEVWDKLSDKEVQNLISCSNPGKLYKDSLPSMVKLNELGDYLKDEEDILFMAKALNSQKVEPYSTDLALKKKYLCSLRNAQLNLAEKDRFNATLNMVVYDWTKPPKSSWRLTGCVKVSEQVKNTYLAHRLRPTEPLELVERNDGPHVKHRGIRVSSRRDLGRKERFSTNRNGLYRRQKEVRLARSPIHDWGLYACQFIPKGEIVVEYIGERIRLSLADSRERNYEYEGIFSSYIFKYSRTHAVDATKKGSLSRFVNHSCAPNCTAQTVMVNKEPCIAIKAIKDIHPDEELTYDYRFAVEPEEDRIKCLCGTPECRGYLN